MAATGSTQRRNRWLFVLVAVVIVLVLFRVAVWGFQQATGLDVPLPFEPAPTRISESLTPFSDIPGFTKPTPYPTATPAS